MAKPAGVVEVVGLAELRRDLIRFDKDYMPKALVAAGVKVAEPLANRIQGVIPHLTGDLSGSVRVAKVRTGASIRVGNTSVPYVGPVEFGGYPAGRTFMAGGRYIYPTAQGMAPQAIAAYAEEVQAIMDSYPWEQAK